MLRVKDPKVSLEFYQNVLGMDLLSEAKFSDFTLYFLAFNHSGKDLTAEEKEASRFSREGKLTSIPYPILFSLTLTTSRPFTQSRHIASLTHLILSPPILPHPQPIHPLKFQSNLKGVLELTHNHGTESDPSFAGYASGNTEPGKGFGHIAITVDDVDKACERFEKLGVQFKKRPTDGKMRNIAFILDPDGYWIEIVPGVLNL
ncbi:hypothetical protein CVT24_007335 [Panaeolus cyanescens]|uniref:lactoylglutathione lyase n=1 Tax=Panaeolus cyanescens TaxID=181874 RepID=A0A409W580_9AGAR|nr:hypothetical protein CVT24_007335 [Panaeolus cyanescens]